MGESIWKKEISFGKKDKGAPAPDVVAAAVEPTEPKQSIWKKEIGGSKKPKKVKEPKVEAASEPKQSIWKKEIGGSKKPKQPNPEPAAEAAPEPKQSIWKKEIGGSKTPKQQKAPKEPKAEKQPFWKKEISLGKKTDDDEVARLVELATRTVDPEFAPVEQPTVAPTQIAEAVVAATPVEPEPDVHPVELLPVDEPVVVAPVAQTSGLSDAIVAASADVPAVEPFVEPVAEIPSVEPVASAPFVDPVAEIPSVEPVRPAPFIEPVTEIPSVEPARPAPFVEPVTEIPSVEPVAAAPAQFVEPVIPVIEPVAQQPVVEPVIPVVEPGPVEQWMEPHAEQAYAAEPWLAEPEYPPVPEAETQVVLHPPVALDELPELPSQKVPFWKKELSFGRKPKAELPALPVVEGVHPPVPAAELPPLATEKVPFWKKEIGGSKKPKKTKEPKSAQPPKPERAKKSFSLPQLTLPSLPSRSGGHTVKRLVGLKIGASQLAAARIANNGAAELLQVARKDLESGVVVAGELRDPDGLANALKDFFAENKLPRKNVRLGIASNRIGVRTFDIGGIDDAKQLENAIHFRAQEALPIPLDEAVLDYHILEERVDDEGNSMKRVLLVVAYRELVDRYVAACRKAGITLAGIDLEAFALLRALSAPRTDDQPSDSALVAVAIGHDRSTFAVSDGRVCEFTRVLDWGGSALNVAIARALDLAPSEAEGIKRAVSLSSPDVPDGISVEHYAHAVDAVRKQIQTFARELVSSLQFYQNQPGSLGIGEIVITGGTANLGGLADELQRLIGVRVRVGDPLARLKLTKKVAVDEANGSYAVAIGLGIED